MLLVVLPRASMFGVFCLSPPDRPPPPLSTRFHPSQRKKDDR